MLMGIFKNSGTVKFPKVSYSYVSWKRDYHFEWLCIVNMVGYALWNIYIKVRYLFTILFTYQKIKKKNYRMYFHML